MNATGADNNKFNAEVASARSRRQQPSDVRRASTRRIRRSIRRTRHGTFRNIKWAVMAITLGIYYILPWIRWDRGPGLPNQAFLLDFANQRLLFGPIEIWAQEFYYVTGRSGSLRALLFLVTAIAGRMWCGYACPQTVWTDLMIAVERFWQGDRNARLRLDQQQAGHSKRSGRNPPRIFRGYSSLSPPGGALVFYFRDAPTLASRTRHRNSSASRLRLSRHFHADDLSARRHSRASRSAFTCAHGRASKGRCSTMIPYSSPIAMSAASRAARTSGTKAGKAAAIASTAKRASPFARRASTSATARSSSASSARLCIDACNEIMDQDRPSARADRLYDGRQPRKRDHRPSRRLADRTAANDPLFRF